MDLISILRLTPISISKSLSPGRVLRTPLDPSGQGAAAPRTQPNEARSAATTNASEGYAQPHGLHPHDRGRLCVEGCAGQRARPDRLGPVRAAGPDRQGRYEGTAGIPRHGPGAVHGTAPHRQQREPDRTCNEQQPPHRRDVRLAQREQADERPALRRASFPENRNLENEDRRQ